MILALASQTIFHFGRLHSLKRKLIVFLHDVVACFSRHQHAYPKQVVGIFDACSVFTYSLQIAFDLPPFATPLISWKSVLRLI